MKKALYIAALVLLAGAACRPETSATEQAASTPASAAPTDSSAPAPTAEPTAANPADTLRLPGGRVLPLRPTTAAVFNKLPASQLPDVRNDPAAEQLGSTKGRVRRQGLDLFLKTTQGPEVKLSTTPDAEFTLENTNGVKYRYWSSLPAAHQWVVRAWYWESSGTVLVDQRTGRRAELIGDPAASPNGRLILLTSPGLGGGDQANLLEMVEVDATGPHLRWRREPAPWEPEDVRWASPTRAVLKRRHANADGSMADDAPISYVELDFGR